jgi:hypothetical protein
MADRFNWKDVAEFVGIGAIVASLIFVGMQMRQAQEIAIADGYSELSSSMFARSDLIYTYSPLIAKANSDEQLSDAEAIALKDFVDAMWKSTNFAWRRWELLDLQRAGPVTDLSHFLCQNPGLIRIWIDQSNGFMGVTNEERARSSDDTARFFRAVDVAIDNRCGE